MALIEYSTKAEIVKGLIKIIEETKKLNTALEIQGKMLKEIRNELKCKSP